MTRRHAVPFFALLLASAACSGRPKVTDTGYVGTWSRGNERNVSIVAIAKQGERYLFRWTKRSMEASFEVKCGWDGHCEESLAGRKMATYDFSTRIDPASGRLLVECDERRLEPEKTEIHYVDELVVEPGGKVLRSYTIERQGKELKGEVRPMRSFEKVADAVAGVTPGAGP